MGLTSRENKLLSQFANNNYGLYNKTLARKLGLHESIFLGEIISEYDYWSKKVLKIAFCFHSLLSKNVKY